MARPIKDNADYFSHDSDMRDDPKIKALRRRFKVAGYGVWCMLLEAMTDSDNFLLKYDKEILSGDFDIEPDFLDEIVNYCLQLGLLFKDESQNVIFSKTLLKRFESLLSKRKRDRNELSTAIIPNTDIIDIESTHSKVKESIEEKSTSKKPIEERRKLFYESLTPFVDKYGKEILRSFYDYWTEADKRGLKLRFEDQKFFDVSKRLATWYKREDKFKNSAKQTDGQIAIESPFKKRVIHA